MIDKNKLIDALHEACEKDSFKKLPSWVINVINKQPEEDRWVPIEEALPKKFSMILVTLKNGAVFEALYLPIGTGYFRMNSLRFEEFSPINPVIAWKSLPKPYEVER